MTALEVWYSHLDAELFVRNAETPEAGRRWRKPRRRSHAKYVGTQISENCGRSQHGRPRIIESALSYLSPRNSATVGSVCVECFQQYLVTLPGGPPHRSESVKLVDVARQGRWEWAAPGRAARLALLMAGPHDPLLLQCKEARPSALAPYAGKSRYVNQGERVVTGQRMLQSRERSVSWLDERRPGP